MGEGSVGGRRSLSGPDIELTMEDVLSVSIRSPPALFNLILIPNSLNVSGEWVAVILGPYE